MVSARKSVFTAISNFCTTVQQWSVGAGLPREAIFLKKPNRGASPLPLANLFSPIKDRP
jgi:hypothetical protein